MLPESGPRKPRVVRAALDRHALPALAVTTSRQPPPLALPSTLWPTDDGEQARSANHLRAAVRHRPSAKTTKPPHQLRQPHHLHKSPRAALLLLPPLQPVQHQRTTRIETHDTTQNNADHGPVLEEMWRVAASSAAATQQQLQKTTESSVVAPSPQKSVGNQDDEAQLETQQPTSGTTLARYRRLVGTHARKTLLLIQQHAATRVAKQRLEHTCAACIQRIVRRFLGCCRRAWLVRERTRAAQRIQQHWRRALVRRKVAVQRQQRLLRERQREHEEEQRRLAARDVQQRYHAFAEAKRAKKQSQRAAAKEKDKTPIASGDTVHRQHHEQQQRKTMEMRTAVARGVIHQAVITWRLRRRWTKAATTGKHRAHGRTVAASRDPVMSFELSTGMEEGDGDERRLEVQETTTVTPTTGAGAARAHVRGADHGVAHDLGASRPSSGDTSSDTPATTLAPPTMDAGHTTRLTEEESGGTDPVALALVMEPSATMDTLADDDAHRCALATAPPLQLRCAALSARGAPHNETRQAPRATLCAQTQSAWSPAAPTIVPPRGDPLATLTTPVASLGPQHQHQHHSAARATISRFLSTSTLPRARHQLAQRHTAATRIQQLLRQRLARQKVAFQRQLRVASLRQELQSHWLHTDAFLINRLFQPNNARGEAMCEDADTNSYAMGTNHADDEDDDDDEEIFNDLEKEEDSGSTCGGVCWAEILPTRNGTFPSGLAVPMHRTTSSYSGHSGSSLPLWKWSWTTKHWEPNRALLPQTTKPL